MLDADHLFSRPGALRPLSHCNREGDEAVNWKRFLKPFPPIDICEGYDPKDAGRI